VSDATEGRGLSARLWLLLGVGLLAILVAASFWHVGHGLLVVFSAILFAVVLDGLTGLICRYTRLSRGVALALSIAVIVVALGALFWSSGVRAANQAPALRRALQEAMGQLGHLLHRLGVSPEVLSAQAAGKGMIQSAITGLLTSQASITQTVSFAGDQMVILVAGIYFAVNPEVYTETVIKLFPPARRARLREVRAVLANALHRWVAGRFAAMLAVGVVVTVGLLLLNVRLALILGFIAGAFTFLPYLGTVISVVPAALIGLLNGAPTALYVIILFFGAHLLEGYVLTPLIQQETVHLPPSWLIVAQLFGLLLAGILGMALATPLVVVITILVQMLYVQDVLGDDVRVLGGSRDVPVPAEGPGGAGPPSPPVSG